MADNDIGDLKMSHSVFGPSYQPIAELGSSFERANYDKIAAQKATMDLHNNTLRTIADSISTINTYSKDDTLDLTIPQVKKMVENLRGIMPELLDEMIKTETDKISKVQLETFKEELSRRPETIHPLINQAVSRINQLFQEGNQVMDISVELIKLFKDLILHIIQHTPAH